MVFFIIAAKENQICCVFWLLCRTYDALVGRFVHAHPHLCSKPTNQRTVDSYRVQFLSPVVGLHEHQELGHSSKHKRANPQKTQKHIPMTSHQFKVVEKLSRLSIGILPFQVARSPKSDKRPSCSRSFSQLSNPTSGRQSTK